MDISHDALEEKISFVQKGRMLRRSLQDAAIWYVNTKQYEQLEAEYKSKETWIDQYRPEQFEEVFKHPLQAIGPALWLVGRWSQMGCFRC